MEFTPTQQRLWPSSLAAEYENISRETDPEFRDLALLCFAGHLEGSGQREDARDLYRDLAQSSFIQVRRNSQQKLDISLPVFGQRVERWMERGSQALADPKVFLSLAVGGLLLRVGAAQFGALALDAAASLQSAWRGFSPFVPRFASIAGLGLLAACRSRSGSGFTGVSDWRRHESIEINGDDSIGQVLYIRQAHDFPGLSARDTKEITDYQWHILQELETERPLHVFLESFTEDYPPRSKFQPRPALLELIRSVFPIGVPRDLDSQQRKTLLEEGAGLVYAAIHDDVSVHKTWTLKEAVENYRSLFEGTGRQALAPELAMRELHWIVPLEKNEPQVFAARESMATREIMDFLKQKPGAKAVLIFGAAHDFSDDFKKLEKPPGLRTVVWGPN